tara:strand:- start:800 stop:1498 length:699 start_codon:yes stop_codon:yes gene_type:complete
MINHKHKCIFIHIQRTAGSYIEQFIDGRAAWEHYPKEKHLLASQAKKLYKEYWNDYFKFSIIRNPWERMTSMLEHYPYLVDFNKGKLNLDNYKTHYGDTLTLEFDRHFWKREDLLSQKHQEGKLYSNILDEELDFIASYENLAGDMSYVFSQIGITKKIKVKKQGHGAKWAKYLGNNGEGKLRPKAKIAYNSDSYLSYHTPDTINDVFLMHQHELDKYNYTAPTSSQRKGHG